METIYNIFIGLITDPITFSIICLIFVGWIINLFGIDEENEIVGFKYKEMPSMRPIRIDTAGRGFWSSIWHWFSDVRTWEIIEDWNFELEGKEYVIPKGFIFDGASVPKFLASWLSPIGILLLGGLVHDFIYKYEFLLLKNNDKNKIKRKEADKLFRDINIEQNGIHVLNYTAYFALRLFGFSAWKKHRKSNKTL
jgi:hypothetical protein